MINKNNKFVKFIQLYFWMLVSCTFVFTVISIFIDVNNFKNMIQAFMVGLILPAVLNTFLWDKNTDPIELWFKRIFYCIISIGFIMLCIMLFNNKLSIYTFALGFGVGLAVALLLGIPVWIIADKRQKKP